MLIVYILIMMIFIVAVVDRVSRRIAKQTGQHEHCHEHKNDILDLEDVKEALSKYKKHGSSPCRNWEYERIILKRIREAFEKRQTNGTQKEN